MYAVALSCAACTVTIDRDERTVEDTERARFAAMIARDVDALAPLLASELTYCHSTGEVENKAQFLEGIRSRRRVYNAIDLRELTVRHQSSDVAVLSGLANVRVVMGGNPAQFDVRFMDTYVMRDGRWQLLTWQSTRVQ